MKNKIDKINLEIIRELSTIKGDSDLGDIGNAVGYVIANYFDDKELGYNKDSFIRGLNHGISLIDGTHG